MVKELLTKLIKTGWKVTMLHAIIGLAWLGVYAVMLQLFGGVETSIDNIADFGIFTIILAGTIILYLVINGFVAQRIFDWE